MKDYPLFEVILEFNPTGIKRLELHSSTITDCNEALANSIGYAREELIGQPLNTICKKENFKNFSELSHKNETIYQAIDFKEMATILEFERMLKNYYLEASVL